MDFHDTIMGQKFYERDVPALIKSMKEIPALIDSINRLTRETKRLADLQEEANCKNNR